MGGVKYTAKRKDGTLFPVVAYRSVIAREKQIVGFRGLVLDDTRRKQMEEFEK